MGISYDPTKGLFHLRSPGSSYVLQVLETGLVAHVFWGGALRQPVELGRIAPQLFGEAPATPVLGEAPYPRLSLDLLPQEYPAYGRTDFREPAYQVALDDGSTVTDLRYQSHQIYPGKRPLVGLPATFVERGEDAESLDLTLADEHAGLEVVLTYTVYRELNVVTRSARFTNKGSRRLRLLRAFSGSVDFPDDRFELLQLSGAWARERHLWRRPLVPGIQAIGSTRGASSHHQNPFLALLRPETDEHHGHAYGFSLVYSGSFLAQAEVNHYGQTRVAMGIHPLNFSWLLEPGEIFQTPELILVYSDRGLNGLSQTFHDLFRRFLLRGPYRDRPRPVLLNSWEATYFNFTEERLLELAREAQALGMELFVLDDGWFGRRNDDTSSLGDWEANKAKLPRGLKGLGEAVNDLGLAFGLWVEPEMVSPDSDLYRAHPDWCLHVPGRSRSLGRNQLVLDLTREEVRRFIVDRIGAILRSAPIAYVKWDMNRYMTEVGSAGLPPERQQETAHRYILGLYQVLEELTEAFPHVLFEGCAGGGGRFDPGILYYMPQIWTSDDTDAVERLKIQYGTSIVYPLVTMGAHVSAAPNHQVGRVTPLATRGDVALFGNMGYELDVTRLDPEEKAAIQAQVVRYKRLRALIHRGDFYRLLSPFEGNETAWMVVAKDRREVLLGFYRVLAQPNPRPSRLRLVGLDPALEYELVGQGERWDGDQLMEVGLTVEPYLANTGGDFQSVVLHWRAVGPGKE
ncbi:MAG: alpha-galactosidase [Firmicutes bacterium]|nr:alpha-galactosidase [Bacillota bacterium]